MSNTDDERRERYAAAIGKGLPMSSGRARLVPAMNAMAVADGEQAELRSKAENLAVMYNQSQTQVSDLIDERDQIREELAELRAEVLAEAQREVVIWLNKKAVEYRSVRGPSADTVKTLASKVSRGAIRIFQDQASDSQEVKTTP